MNENKTWLSDILKKMFEEFIKFIETGKTSLMPIYEKFISDMKNVIEDVKLASRIVVIETPVITLDGIKNAAKENMVSGATEIVALKEVTENEKLVWLTYSDNRELLSQEKNKYIAIKGESFDKEVEKLFGEEKLIIIKS